MKRQLRVSGLKDYVAVDIIDEKGKILETPFSINLGEVKTIKYKDTGEEPAKVYIVRCLINKTFTAMDAVDSEGFEFDFPFEELAESHIKF